MTIREELKGYQITTLYALWDESVLWDATGALPGDALAREVHRATSMGSVSFVLFAQILFAEVWRALYVLSSSRGEL